MSVFETLNKINVNEHIEKKNGLSYLSWAWAWATIKTNYPEASYTIYENQDGWNYFTDGRTGWVKTGVTIEGLEMIEYLPIMDFRNKSIVIENITSFDVNKTIQRSLTKACARHGLGLYIYAGEDLPVSEEAPKVDKVPKLTKEQKELSKFLKRFRDPKGVEEAMLKKFGVDFIEDMSKEQCVEAIAIMTKKLAEAHKQEDQEFRKVAENVG